MIEYVLGLDPNLVSGFLLGGIFTCLFIILLSRQVGAILYRVLLMIIGAVIVGAALLFFTNLFW